MRPLKTPDLTPAQFVAIIGAVLAAAISFSVPISPGERDVILQLASILGSVLFAADATIRHGRSRSMITPPKGEKRAETTSSSKRRRRPTTPPKVT
jgi:hypothetical protein